VVTPFFKLVGIDQTIQLHLRAGGTVHDEVGVYLIEKFVDEFLSIGATSTGTIQDGGDPLPTSKSGSHLWALHRPVPRGQISPATLRYIQVLREGIEESGLTRADLTMAFSASIEGLMPNPCILAGGPMLAGALPFREPLHQMHGLWQLGDELTKQGGSTMTSSQRAAFIRQTAITMAKTTKGFHEMAKGAPKFSIDAAGSGISMELAKSQSNGSARPWGCLVLLLAVVLLIGGLAFGLYLLFK
jgi:hypothetical protein